MKIKLVWCPICEKRLKVLNPTTYGCELCSSIIELTNLNYSIKDSNMVLAIEYTIVDNSERR